MSLISKLCDVTVEVKFKSRGMDVMWFTTKLYVSASGCLLMAKLCDITLKVKCQGRGQNAV